MKLLKHREMPDGTFQMAVHVDPQKKLAKEHPLVLNENTEHKEGDPDPDFVREFTWPPMPEGMLQHGTEDDPGPKMTKAQYTEMQRREAKLLIEAETTKTRDENLKGKAVGKEGTDL